jgi:hypothetical protein
MALLPRHVDTILPWLDQAAEVVVVDSESKDGTVDFLKEKLHHPNLRFLNHPPGLYQSWNFGIGQIRRPYFYISTIGDSITGEGLEHMAETAERLQADVVVSKPAFVDEHDRPLAASQWPIDDIRETLGVDTEPVAVEKMALFLFALANCFGAVLGSSASNLYRTSCMQQRPFPTGFGTVGDGAWGLQHSLDVRFAVTPRTFSTFRHHPKTYNVAEYKVNDLPLKLYQLACDTLRRRRAEDPVLDALAKRVGLDAIAGAMEEHLRAQQRLEICRASRVPWIFNPQAWQARRARSEAFRRLHQLKHEGLKQIGQQSGKTGK